MRVKILIFALVGVQLVLASDLRQANKINLVETTIKSVSTEANQVSTTPEPEKVTSPTPSSKPLPKSNDESIPKSTTQGKYNEEKTIDAQVPSTALPPTVPNVQIPINPQQNQFIRPFFNQGDAQSNVPNFQRPINPPQNQFIRPFFNQGSSNFYQNNGQPNNLQRPFYGNLNYQRPSNNVRSSIMISYYPHTSDNAYDIYVNGQKIDINSPIGKQTYQAIEQASQEATRIVQESQKYVNQVIPEFVNGLTSNIQNTINGIFGEFNNNVPGYYNNGPFIPNFPNFFGVKPTGPINNNVPGTNLNINSQIQSNNGFTNTLANKQTSLNFNDQLPGHYENQQIAYGNGIKPQLQANAYFRNN